MYNEAENSQKIEAMTGEFVLGISIVNYFSLDSVASLIGSLVSFTEGITTKVSIVDNSLDSENRESEGLRRLAESSSSELFTIDVTQSPINLGYGAGNNLAVTVLLERGATVVWILNPDTRVRGRGANLIHDLKMSPSRIWATSTIENDTKGHGLGTLNTLTGRGSTSSKSALGRRTFSFEYPAGHSILFRREAWLELGGFDDRYFLFMEEADLALRAHQLGIGMDTLSSVTVEHDQGLTTGSTPNLAAKSVTAFRESTKSRVIFFRRFYPLRLPILLCSRIAYALLVRAKGNAAGSRAVVEGMLSGIRQEN
ncbi:MAG: glycosyltransferase family 2 protein [Flaviaesturariibacter sp.]|nr:glycosyltransferase family 2 protein [Flaviaesturariibacter sp.]